MLGHLQQLPPTIRTTHRSGELVLRLVGDVDQFVRFLSRTAPLIVEYLSTTVATLTAMLWLQPALAIFAVLVVPGLAAVVLHYGRRLGGASRERRRRGGGGARPPRGEVPGPPGDLGPRGGAPPRGGVSRGQARRPQA